MKSTSRFFIFVTLLLGLGMLGSACSPVAMPTSPSVVATSGPVGSTSQPTGTATSSSATPTQGGAGGAIGFLLPNTEETRYESADRPDFEAKFMELCPSCKIYYNNANQDPYKQISQAGDALFYYSRVLVVDPVDPIIDHIIPDNADHATDKAVAYDRLILNTDKLSYYVSYDSFRMGQVQAQSLVDDLTSMNVSQPNIVMIDGSPADLGDLLLKQGAHSVFDPLVAAGRLTIAEEYQTPDGSSDQAQSEMKQALAALKNQVDGVYVANDGEASGVIKSMKAAHISPLPPVTGQDAALDAIQRILVGEQYMTLYKPVGPEAEAAAQVAYDLLSGTGVPASMTNGATTNNGSMDVPSVLLTPVAITKDNIKDTVVAGGLWTVDQICTSDYADACEAAGLQ